MRPPSPTEMLVIETNKMRETTYSLERDLSEQAQPPVTASKPGSKSVKVHRKP